MHDPTTLTRWREFSQTARPTTSAEWKRHFEKSHTVGLNLTGPRNVSLSEEQRAKIVPSVQEFQLGEQSEGRNLMRFAVEYAEKTGDWDYPEAIRFFILEENRHAKELLVFLKALGEKPLRRSKIDRVFSHVRRMADLELSITVLVTAEIVATVYYQALGGATDSSMLKELCRGILRDEDFHIRFQFEQLGRLRWNRSLFGYNLWKGIHLLLLVLAIVAIWPKHGPVLRMGGFGFWRTLQSALAEIRTGFRWMEQDFSGEQIEKNRMRPGVIDLTQEKRPCRIHPKPPVGKDGSGESPS